jgi:hypothetical protein
MRRAKEMMRPDHRDRFGSNVFGSRMLNVDFRGAVLSSLPAPDLLATFIWLFPDAEVSAERRLLWRFNLATLQANSGAIATARKGFQSLVGELEATGQPGRLLDETQRSLAPLGTGAAVKAEAVKKMAK